jgi:hypothetical protein
MQKSSYPLARAKGRTARDLFGQVGFIGDFSHLLPELLAIWIAKLVEISSPINMVKSVFFTSLNLLQIAIQYNH